MTKLSVVVGAQYGSEAKGHVTARVVRDALAHENARVAVVRVAGPNAGHTAYNDLGEKFAFRQIPVGVVVDNVDPGTKVVAFIAAGSEIDPEVLFEEILICQKAGINLDLFVDPEATIIKGLDKSEETTDMASKESLVRRIGSTGKGIGAARAERLMRAPGRRVQDDPDLIQQLHTLGVKIDRVAVHLRYGNYSHIVIEGTQGYGLGLHAGHYPQCTSSDCRAVDFLAMAGVSPWDTHITGFEIWAVARVYPIRVAGNSGPLRNETTWAELGLPPEYTTVTKKERRVGGEDWRLVANAVEANGGAPAVRLAISMVDQKFPALADVDWDNLTALRESIDFVNWIQEIEDMTGAPVRMVTTSPKTGVWIPEGGLR